MTDDIEWGPWHRHEGGAPKHWENAKEWPRITVMGFGLRREEERGPDSPAFLWHWSGILRWRRRVPQPGFGCITAYRFGRIRPRSAQVDRLAEIVAKPSQPITAPEGPVRERVKTKGRTE